ncbi:MAG: uroporphyrinogen-III C-methyltransferase [Bacillota bacterium]
MREKGKVFLVGAGPGDYRLITSRGENILNKADIIFYDRLVNPSLLALIPPEIEKIYVGKSRNKHSCSQSEINQMLTAEAKKGKIVVRLKGGDPFVFGRGGEEALHFTQSGIEFEIIPGISSVIGAAAYAGIPVTHRGISSSFHVFTGHSLKRLDFKNMAEMDGTLIIVMGLKNLGEIAKNLCEKGLSSQKPVAVIRYGTTADQKVVTGNLSSIEDKVKSQGITPPVLTVIGEVVNLRQKINWFEQKSLSGRRIMITRPYGQQKKIEQMIENQGAEVLHFPSIEIQGPVLNNEVKKAVNNLKKYDWILFTSRNGVKYWFQLLQKENIDIRELIGIKFGVIGPGTGSALKKRGIYPEFMPSRYTTSVMTDEFIGLNHNKSKSVLLPRADIASPGLATNLRETGYDITNISIYKTIKPGVEQEPIISHLEERSLELITFTSSSTVNNLVEIFKENIDNIKDIPVACIGPVTASTARKHGFDVIIEAEEHTIPGLVNSIKKYYNS